MRTLYIVFLFAVSFAACTENSNTIDERQVLPILGNRDLSPEGDTIYHTTPDFSFINQDSQIITRDSFADKVFIVDFFFISCPSICPKVTAQMLRIYEKFKDNDRVGLLAHTVDPKRDTVEALKRYATALGVKEGSNWHFITGDKDEIYDIADEYFIPTPAESPDAPGGFDHSGRIILVDTKGRVRSFALGTDEEEVTRFIRDIEILLNEL